MDDNFNTQTMVRYLLGRSRIKYDTLETLTGKIKLPESDGVLLLVDADAILYRLYRNRDLSMIYSMPSELVIKDIVVAFLNTIGHYRRFIHTRLRQSNEILIFWSDMAPTYQTSLVPEYRSDYFTRCRTTNATYGPLHKLVRDAMKFAASVIPYFDHIYMIDTESIDVYTAMSSFLQAREYEKYIRIIFSRNMICSQLVDSRTVQLYNKRDDSRYITGENVFENGILYGLKTRPEQYPPIELLPHIMALGGCTDLGVKHSKYAPSCIEVIKKIAPLVMNGTITKDMSIQSFIKIYAEIKGNYTAELRMGPTAIYNRYKAFNLKESIGTIQEQQRIQLQKSRFDLFDQNGLENINDRLAMVGDDVLEITNLNMSSYQSIDDIEDASSLWSY